MHEHRQAFNVPVSGELHFTPDGVSRPPERLTTNIALLTEGLAETSVCAGESSIQEGISGNFVATETEVCATSA
jgi:hypothetical protein